MLNKGDENFPIAKRGLEFDIFVYIAQVGIQVKPKSITPGSNIERSISTLLPMCTGCVNVNVKGVPDVSFEFVSFGFTQFTHFENRKESKKPHNCFVPLSQISAPWRGIQYFGVKILFVFFLKSN